MKSVIAVIVTYNRLTLLQVAVESVRKQTYAITNLLVIDNGSTDGTSEWLRQQKDMVISSIIRNTGASGGFSYGLKVAAEYKTDWIWVMDDDTICEPITLENLMNKVALTDQPVGFIGSKCIWTNGDPHLMNVPDIKPMFNERLPFNHFDGYKVLLTDSNSWVSLLLNRNAVTEVGLPYKEFFFWSDDLEYTQRITKSGYLGFYSIDSSVTHNTIKNYCPDFYNETANNVWKHKYGFRNEFFLKKKNIGAGLFLFWLIAKVGYTSFKLIKIRKDHHLKFIWVIVYAAWKSIFFNPVIEKIHQPNSSTDNEYSCIK